MYSRDVVQIESKDFVSNQHNSGQYHWNKECKCNKSYKSKKAPTGCSFNMCLIKVITHQLDKRVCCALIASIATKALDSAENFLSGVFCFIDVN